MAATRVLSSTRAARASVYLLVALSLPTGVAAQSGCGLGEGSDVFRTQADPRGGRILRFTAPHFVCDDDVEIWADSAVVYEIDNISRLYGSVRYVDLQREMSADNARYFTNNAGRLEAEGHVLVTNFEDGSTIQNGDLVYLRQTDYREVEEMTVRTGPDGLRPRATVYPKRAEPADTADMEADTTLAVPIEPDGALQEQEPTEPAAPEQYIVVGDRLIFRGSDYFNATGTVEIERESMLAFSDSAEYTGEFGRLVLDGSARVVSSSYELVGRTITLASAADGTDEINALREAILTGEDLNVTAPHIVLSLVDDEIDRMVAVPLPSDEEADVAASAEEARRPLAIAEDIEMTGDSLDLAAPGGVIQRIFSAGNARSVSAGRPELNVESLPEMARRDWIEADSIEVILAPVVGAPEADPDDGAAPTDAYEVDHIIARVGARSLYRLVPSDSAAVVGVDPPAVNYTVADQITIFMVEGEADRVEAIGQVSGWHLEPLAPAAPDSLDLSEVADSVPPPAVIGSLPAQASDDTPNGDGGDGPPLGTYLSPVSATPQRRRLP